jgi:hypothetical protein
MRRARWVDRAAALVVAQLPGLHLDQAGWINGAGHSLGSCPGHGLSPPHWSYDFSPDNPGLIGESFSQNDYTTIVKLCKYMYALFGLTAGFSGV